MPQLEEPLYNDVFSHGYLLTNGKSRKGIAPDWNHAAVGPFRGYFEPKTQFVVLTGRKHDCTVLLVGQVIDISCGFTDLKSVASLMAARYEKHGLDATIRYVAYLGGRFTCHLYADDTLTVIPDSVAS